MIQSFQTSTMTSKQIDMKIVFLGNMGVGKSSIIQRFTKNIYHSDQTPTVGIDILTRTITCNSNTYKLSLWDTAGQQKFLSMITSYLKMGRYCIVVFDVTNKKSFEELSRWINMYQQHGSQASRIAIMGNKIDLPRSVTKDEARSFAKKLGYPYFQISARTGQNIQNAFISLIKTWNTSSQISPPPKPPTPDNPPVDATSSKTSLQSNNSNKPVIVANNNKDWNKQRDHCCHI